MMQQFQLPPTSIISSTLNLQKMRIHKKETPKHTAMHPCLTLFQHILKNIEVLISLQTEQPGERVPTKFWPHNKIDPPTHDQPIHHQQPHACNFSGHGNYQQMQLP